MANMLAARIHAPGGDFRIDEIERPQPALGGNKPADLLDTPTGLQVVSRTLGALESGAYL